MGIHDRDWYRDEVRKREESAQRPPNVRPDVHKRSVFSRSESAGERKTYVWSIALLAGMFGLALIVYDMQHRGAPFTFHGIRWWLSLWFGAPSP
jgi:hypothetical protein